MLDFIIIGLPLLVNFHYIKWWFNFILYRFCCCLTLKDNFAKLFIWQFEKMVKYAKEIRSIEGKSGVKAIYKVCNTYIYPI